MKQITLVTTIIIIITMISHIECIFSYGSYRAAVVEYSTTREPFYQPEEIVWHNAEEYVKLIKKAASKLASIVLFPEHGLTSADITTKSKNQILAYSIEIPDLAHKPNPCINESLHKILRLLSCAALESSIYVVVNILERQDHKDDYLMFSTNVVFDRKGTIIAKYRKINVIDESNLQRGNDLLTFTTDFGVTFAVLIGYDIFYKRPSLEAIQEKNVTNVLYSTAWISETPFLQALSIQAGYARTTGVNLLAAGLNDPAEKYGGSGIYLYDGKVAELYISPSKSSKLLVQEVPKIHIKISAIKCNNNSQVMPRFRLGGNLNVGSFSTLTDNLKHHTLMPLNQHGLETKATICNHNGVYCCKFHVIVQRKPIEHNYRLSMFYGIRNLGSKTVGVRSCGVISCSNGTDDHSCGERTYRSATVFTNISIIGSFRRSDETNDFPITLTYDLTPITEYTYCETANDDKQTITAEMITTQSVSNILSFGIYGRMFEHDGGQPGPITSNATPLLLPDGLILVILTILLVGLAI